MNNPILFTSLIKDEELLKALDKMKFIEPTPVQAQSIQPMLEGKDITVQAPTGTGKTGAFGLPILQNINPIEKTIQALILSPTRELAVQIAEVLKELARFKPGIKVATIYGGERIEKQFAILRRKPQIVVATPGRLMDHMDRNTIKLDSLSILVLDEADRMLDMGFRPDLNRILKLVPTTRQTALFSATISKEIQEIAKNYQIDPVTIKIAQDSLTVDSVEQFYSIVKRNSKIDELLALFVAKHPKRSIVFTNTKKMSENIVASLKRDGYRAAFLHGDLRQGQRNHVMAGYKSGKIDILVATDVAARGIDISNVDMVINYDLPREEDSYVHRIGRTGRADKKGVAYTFVYKAEYHAIKELMKSTNAVITQVDAFTGIIEDAPTDLPEKKKPRKAADFYNKTRRRPRTGGFKSGPNPEGEKKKKPSGYGGNFAKRAKPSRDNRKKDTKAAV